MKINKYLFLFALIFGLGRAEAHPLPQCKAQLVVNNLEVLIHFKAPQEILELAQKNAINLKSPSSVDSLKKYVLNHVFITDSLKSNWHISFGKMSVQEINDISVGNFPEINIDILLSPSKRQSLKDFTLNWDLIIHQIPTQSIIFSIEQDWQNGIIQDNSKQIGIIALDIPTGEIHPLRIKLVQGTWFKGFKSMVFLGIKHISEGTDHLLFLLVLLLPIPLLVKNQKWSIYRAVRPSLIHILKVVTAFTIGHSITLLFGALGWVILPSKSIEILIGVSILVSAIHAIKPIFPNKEIYIALGFGLIHGLAFANTLQDLNLDTTKMLLSIFGFNLGIELMQLAVIIAVIPWLILLSRTSFYSVFRIGGAILSIIAASGWIIERFYEKPNVISELIAKASAYAVWLLGALIILSVLGYFLKKEELTIQES